MKPSKKPLFVAVFATLILSMTACQASSDANSDGSGDSSKPNAQPAGAGIDELDPFDEAIAELPDGVDSLRIALTEQTPPSGFVGEDGKTVVGIDADMAVLLGQALKLKMEPLGTSFDQIIPGVESGRYDMTIAAMSPTAERMEVLDFVDYFRTGTNVAVVPGNPDNISLSNLCGKHVSVLKGSVQEGKIVPDLDAACKADGKDAIEVSSYPNQQETILSVTSKRVDAAVQSAPPLAWAKKQGAPIDLGEQDTWTTVALGVKKDSGYLAAISKATQYILDSDSYQQVLAKWGVTEHGISAAKINNITY